MDDSWVHESFDWEDTEDITALSDKDLRETLEALSEEERTISYRRRILQGRIDLIRAELVERGTLALGSEELARALLGDLRDEEIR